MKLSSTAMLLLAGLFAVSCSSDDDKNAPGQPGQPDNAITFTAIVPNAPRVATSTETIKAFKVYGFSNGALFMNNVTVNKDGDRWVYSPTQYWPADGQPVNFYSYSPFSDNDASTFVNRGNAHISDYVNNGKTDFLYAVNMGMTSGIKQVQVNFRHALSQVRFFLKAPAPSATQAALKVHVSEVSLVNIYSNGSFFFPEETTMQGTDSKGEWTLQRQPSDPVLYSGDAVTLTTTAQELTNSGYYFAIPQDLDDMRQGVAGAYTTPYVRVRCSIFNDADRIQLWPSKGAPGYDEATKTAYIYFPLAIENATDDTDDWDSGKAYRYNITVGVPSSSASIEFDVTVDEYNEFDQIHDL